MPDFWLKALGMGESGKPIRDDWTNRDNGLLERRVMFPSRPSVKPADRIVYYAAGREWGLIFAEGEATSSPYYERWDKWPRYSWWVNVRLNSKRDFVHDGVRLDALEVDGRDLSKLMRRRSHIRLSPKEYQAAVRGLSG